MARAKPGSSHAVLAAGIFILALALRISNAPYAFDRGIPVVSPIDELYHWKRITWSALHFPGVLQFDIDRGLRGAFCPWPPLYDLLAGGAARLLGARSAPEVLARAVWFPPIVAAIFVALTAAILARACGMRVAIACGIALACSPFVVTTSWIGSIDHHWLEWPLTFAILGATCFALQTRRVVLAGILLGSAISIAMFVQTALLIPAALAFVVLFFFSDGRAAAIGFGIAAIAVMLYRITCLPGYPDNPWFLGWTHVALFAGAAIACVLEKRNRAIALAAGALVVVAIPTALASIVGGIRFFGGETWLHTIQEFQPLWLASGQSLLSYGVGFGAGAIFVWALAVRAVRRRELISGTIAFFAIVHFLLAITSRRFGNAAVPLLALAGAIYAASIVRRRPAMLALGLIALPPPVQFALWMQHPEPVIRSGEHSWIRAARFLRDQQGSGHVLAPWSMGHALDVIGDRAVIIDNFGDMPGAMTFARAHDAMLSLDEEMLARYCRQSGVRWIVLTNPVEGLPNAATIAGIDPAFFIRATNRMPPLVPTRLARATWWWRAYFGHRTFRHFRRVDSDPQLLAAGTPFEGPALQIWESLDAVR